MHYPISNLCQLAVITFSFTVGSIPTSSIYAGSLTGTITSEKKIKESQKPVIIWVEGLAGGPEQSNRPMISQSGVQFLPRVLAVAAGDTVSFPNEDDVAHNVFSMSKAKKFKLGIYPKGDTRDVTFEKTGVIDLFCSIHRHMHAVIVVTPSRHYSQTKLGEAFQIKDIPAGTHTIKVWNSKHKTTEYEVTVPNEGDADLTVTLK